MWVGSLIWIFGLLLLLVEQVEAILRADVAGAECIHNVESIWKSIWGGELIFEKVPAIPPRRRAVIARATECPF